MLFKIRLHPKLGADSPESQRTATALAHDGVSADGVVHRRMFLIDADWSRDDAIRIAREVLADPVLEEAEVFAGSEDEPEGKRLVHVMRQTGVMDPPEQSLERALRDSGVTPIAVKTAEQLVFPSDVDDALAGRVLDALGNAAVDQAIHGAIKLDALPRGAEYAFKRVEVAICGADDDALLAVNRDHSLSLNIEEMRTIRDHCEGLGRDPTDIEIQTLAQTWSEHCKHKTLAGRVHYSESKTASPRLLDHPDLPDDGHIPNLLKDTIKRATDDLDREWCLSVFVDNAGVIAFDDEDALCFKVETHNHPSAIEPYGGAGTGIGGVIRDILGTGLGARPLMNTNVFCFGPPDMADSDVPRGATHPRKIMRGVVSGVRDYGNRMGIPTANGSIHFDERYTGNPLVYAGCVGLIPRDKIKKAANAGDKILVVGGRTGRDGIGGATFSSVELTSESETVSSGAVQIGNAIEEQKVQTTMLKARDAGLFTAVTDCGAGGLSSAVGEMGETLGARVDLTTVPLKYDGLSYLEVWISEAQERMVAAVPSDKVEQTLALFKEEDVDATIIGEFTGDGRLVLTWGEETVCDLTMAFTHDGMPKIERRAEWNPPAPAAVKDANPDANAVLLDLLAHPNIASKEWVIRQYDHEVQSGSAVKPLTGPQRDGPSDAAAIVPKLNSEDAFVVSNGLNIAYADADPYHMAQCNIDEALRNYVATGGDIDHCAILDNFSWGNCAKPDRLGAMVRACYGCLDAARIYGTPFISGKDSLNNEFKTESGETVAIPHTLLISAIGKAVSVDALTTSDFKRAGNRILLLGDTCNELGQSHYQLVTAAGNHDAPRVWPELALARYRALNRAQAAGLVAAAHDLAEGGLAVALAEMCIAGRVGAEVTLSSEMASGDDAANDTALLFSESASRILIEVAPDDVAKVREIFGESPVFDLGEVTNEPAPSLKVTGLNANSVIDQPVADLVAAWKGTIPTAMA